MSNYLNVEKKKGVLWVTATGTRTFEAVLAISNEVLTACTVNKTKKVLVDVRSLKGSLKTLEAYDIPNQYFTKMKDHNTIIQTAILDLKESENRYRFFENVAQNRGFNLRIFSNPDEAVEWLMRLTL